MILLEDMMEYLFGMTTSIYFNVYGTWLERCTVGKADLWENIGIKNYGKFHDNNSGQDFP